MQGRRGSLVLVLVLVLYCSHRDVVHLEGRRLALPLQLGVRGVAAANRRRPLQRASKLKHVFCGRPAFAAVL